MSDAPKPGTFGLAVISGITGKLVRLGQNIVEGRETHYTHAFLVLDRNEVIEAEPGKDGAQVNSIDKYLAADVKWVDPIAWWRIKNGWGYQTEIAYTAKVISVGRSLKGIPYSYLDYLSIGLEHFNLDPKFVRNRVKREDRMICSQLVDFAYNKAGIHLFSDGRLPQDVTPADLQFWAEDNAA